MKTKLLLNCVLSCSLFALNGFATQRPMDIENPSQDPVAGEKLTIKQQNQLNNLQSMYNETHLKYLKLKNDLEKTKENKKKAKRLRKSINNQFVKLIELSLKINQTKNPKGDFSSLQALLSEIKNQL